MRRHAVKVFCLLQAILLAGCTSEKPKPTILLFVYDTVRHDATTPYGAPADATPALARLAREGLVYDHAYAHAPWTLPSHVSLFSGLLPSQHGTGVRSVHAPDELEMIAEVLARAGYQTRAISENPWVGPAFNVTQGFERFSLLRQRSPMTQFEAALDEALADRDSNRPLFLFINVMGAHGPYTSLRSGRLVPSSTSSDDVKSALEALKVAFCSRSDEVRKWRPIWWQLYLSGIRDGDDKLATALERLESEGRPLVAIATADHGQAFGEHYLTSHMYSVREELLHIPLVVRGLDVPPARIDAPVGLVNVRASILAWAGATADGNAAPLPVSPGGRADETVVSEYFDTGKGNLAEESLLLRMLALMREHCTEEDRVEGDMRAVIRYPDKLITYTRYPTELFDLRSDPGEQHDLAAERPDLVRELTKRLDQLRKQPVVDASKSITPSAETLERLRALGYAAPD